MVLTTSCGAKRISTSAIADKMDSNGNKVQTLRQQFEGLTSTTSSAHMNKDVIKNIKKLPTTNSLLLKTNHQDSQEQQSSIDKLTIREMNPLLKNGNRCGFISSSNNSPPATTLPTTTATNAKISVVPSTNSSLSSSLSVSPTSSESNNSINEVISRNRGNRNGIYVTDPVIVFNEEELNGLSSGSGSVSVGGDSDDSTNNNSQCSKGHIVKRSNAFRQRDIVDSPEPRFVRNSKLVLDRVKSLEIQPSKEICSENVHRASTKGGAPRPKSISAPMTKAVNVVTPYQVSDIYTPHQLMREDSKNKEAPEYAVPIPVSNRSPNNNTNYKTPEPPKFAPPPPPVYKSPPRQAQMTRPYSSPYNHRYTTFGKGGNYESVVGPTALAPHDKRTASVCVSTPSVNRGPPPEKPPRTFLYDILVDRNAKTTARNSSMPEILAKDKNTFYRQPSKGPIDKSKVSISTATIRQTTPNSRQQRTVVPQNQLQPPMLVRSKTESQIVLKNKNKPVPNTLPVNSQPRTVRSQPQPQPPHVSQQASYEDQQRLYNLMSNTNLLQQRLYANGANMAVHPLRSESNLVLAGAREDQPRFAAHSQLGLPPSSHYSKEYRISRAHSNSLLFVNNLISMSSGANNNGLSNTNIMYNGIPTAISQPRITLDSRHEHNRLLLEKSKSEWALNRVGFKTVNNNNNEMFPSSSNIETTRMGTARRNTLGATNLLVATSSPVGSSNSNSTPTTGHPSLESNVSSIASTSSSGYAGRNGRPGFQQSIQDLVNQFFSPPSLQHQSLSIEATAIPNSSSVNKSNNNNSNNTKEITSTDSGIQVGSESLSSCDTPVGDSTTDTGDSDCENEPENANNARQVVEARKGYIRRVSSIRVQEIPSIHRLIQTSRKAEHLFECLLVVGLNRDPYTGVYHPYIRDKFPPNAKVAAGVEQFCFPDSLEWPCHEGPTAQSYTLAITDHRGARKYGCCYRILPEGANICIPIAYVIISAHRAIGFYREVLKEITQRHGYSEYQKRYLMEDLYKKPFPTPTENIVVTDPIQDDVYLPYGQQNNSRTAVVEENTTNGLTQCYNNFLISSPKSIVLRRKADQRLEEGDLVMLLSTLDLNTLLKLFGSLLLERKVVLISRSLNALSLCVEALESMLYPFTWQHTFVPILPLTMIDVLDAPAPFLIGCLRSLQTAWDKTLDEGIVIDLDQSKVLSCVGDENNILPKRIYRKIRNAIQFVLNMPDQKESTKNVLISECFIRMFVETLGHFSNHIVIQQDGKKIFQRESFIKSSDTKAIQNFLEWFSETAMFHEFIELRLKGNPPPGLFEQRILEQSELCTPNNNNNNNITQQQNVISSNGGATAFKNSKFFTRGTKPFGNWLKEAFVK